jgi:YfiH family protein
VTGTTAPAWQLGARDSLPVATWPRLGALGLDVVVTTRHGGVSSGPYRSLNLGLSVGDDPDAVVENRRRAAGALAATLDDLVVARQVHGREVATVGAGDRGRGARTVHDAVADADVLVTAEPGPVLMTLVADCVPMVLYAPRQQVLACVHAGWRGTMARVVDAALAAMTAHGAPPTDVVAGIGPAVSPAGYVVGEDVVVAARGAFGGDLSDVVVADGPGRWRCDLVTANRRLLVEAGVPAAGIDTAPVATGAGSPFFSDRAERPCGRFGLLARLRHP